MFSSCDVMLSTRVLSYPILEGVKATAYLLSLSFNEFKVLYSCKEADGNEDQLKLVRQLCQNKEKCRIDVAREFFGNFECPGTDAKDMRFWLVYSCGGGGNDVTKTNEPVCDRVTPTPPSPTPSPSPSPTPWTGKCTHDDPGVQILQLVPGCGGGIDIVRIGGCINVHKVLEH